MNPYELLGLAEGESDERTIKRAYAKLLKQHRPDQDPEGFRRIHEAYQRVLAWRSFRASAPDVVASEVKSPPVNDISSVPSFPVVEPVRPSLRVEPLPIVEPVSTAGTKPPPIVAASGAWDDGSHAVRHAATADPFQAEALLAAIESLAALVDSGEGSGADWAEKVVDAIKSRWDLLQQLLDRPVMDHLLRHLSLKDMQGVFKEVATRQGVPMAGRWLSRWLEVCEQANLLGDDDGPRALRTVAWSTLLDAGLASRLVVQIEDSAIPRTSVEQADRLLGAGAFGEVLPDQVRNYLIGRIIGLRGRADDRQITAVKAALKPLEKDHPLRRLASTQAGIRAEVVNELGGCLGVVLGLMVIFTGLGLIASTLRVVHDLADPMIGESAVWLVLGMVVMLLWKRKAVWALLDRHLFDPLTPAYLWACTWVVFLGAPMLGITLPVNEAAQRAFVWLWTLLTLLVMAFVRRRLARVDRDQGGWRLLVPPWIHALVDPPKTRPLSSMNRRMLLLLSWVWAMLVFSPVLLVEPVSSRFGIQLVCAIWLSGPLSLLAFSIRAWLVVWGRSATRSLNDLRFWIVATMATWLMGVVAIPWLWPLVIPAEAMVGQVVGTGLMLVVGGVASAVLFVWRKGIR